VGRFAVRAHPARLVNVMATFTTAEWEALKDRYDGCPGCVRGWGDIPILPGRRSAITRDHVVPISRVAGMTSRTYGRSTTPATREKGTGRTGVAASPGWHATTVLSASGTTLETTPSADCR
jgi:hypothetical protein